MNFYDTSACLNLLDKMLDEPFIISYITLMELENIKTSFGKDVDVKYRARCVTRLLDTNLDKYQVWMTGNDECFRRGFEPLNDNIILSGAIECNKTTPLIFVTDDLLLKLKGRSAGLKIKSSMNILCDEEEYTGVRTVTMTDDEMSEFYSHMEINTIGCFINEYLVIKNTNDEVVDKRRWTGEVFAELYKKNIKTEKIYPNGTKDIKINLQE